MHLSRKTHGLLDYVFSALFAASPWIFGFADQYKAVDLAIAFGSITALYSLLTNYEMGFIELIPFSVHRLFDILVAILVGGSTWHFSMKGTAGFVFGVLGALFALSVVLTDRPRDAGTAIR
jgi:hypothetical protein